MTLVIEGGRTRSLMARALGVIGPSLASVASADSCDSETGDSGRRKRNCRANRTTASDKSLARRASASVTSQRVPIARGKSVRLVRNGRDAATARRFPESPGTAAASGGSAPAVAGDPGDRGGLVGGGGPGLLGHRLADVAPDHRGWPGRGGARPVDLPVATQCRPPRLTRSAERYPLTR